MGILFATVKCFVFAFNFFSLTLGISIVSVNAFGLEYAVPNTDEHTYCIVGIILGAFLCMTTLFGCYGVVCESLGVNTIYAFFVLTLLVLQLLQMQTYKHQHFFENAVERLEGAWNEVGTSEQMDSIQKNFHCCGLYNSSDYDEHHLIIPKSCFRQRNATVAGDVYQRGCVEAVHSAYQYTMQREKIFNWTLLTTECAILACACILSMLLFQRYRARHRTQSLPDGYLERADAPPSPQLPRFNHINSRTLLLSN